MISSRSRKLNNHNYQNGLILYWMDRDMRAKYNWAMIFAEDLAKKNNQRLVVVYNLVPNFLGGSKRHVNFKVKSLLELDQDLDELNINFDILLDSTGNKTPKLIEDFIKENKIGAIVTDFSPLKIQRAWKQSIAENVSIPMFEVDSHNIVPVWETSNKQEFAAYTIRPKIYRLLPDYLDQFPKLIKQDKKATITTKTDWDYINGLLDDKEDTTTYQPGTKAGQTQLKKFIDSILNRYALDRNNPLAEAQSNLSPYLHYGLISAQQIVLEVLKSTKLSLDQILESNKNKAKVDTNKSLNAEDHVAAFIEELVVRKELSDNFCFYNSNYDNFNGFPQWAQKTLNEHREDVREYIYTKQEFEFAKTHDELWNAAQLEMINTGKMHGYMRMYWAKKILQWTKSPEEAIEIAIYLNDKYELDGRDPNGYTGIAWSIGGVHDRAWFTRPIFGTIRYMAKSGCDKKFDTKKYIKSQGL